MKTAAAVLALLTVLPLQAEVFRPRLGHPGHRHAQHQHRHWAPVHRHGHVHLHVRPWSYGYRYSAPWLGYTPGYVVRPYWPACDYDAGYAGEYWGPSSAATNGLILGGLAGGVIGHNSGEFRHNGWRGAAWGAGLGWILGSIVDSQRRTAVQAAPVTPVVTAAQPATTQAPVTIINNHYYNSAPATPMSAVNALFGR